MKILLINDNGTEVGGAETYTMHLKRGFIERGHEVKVLTSAVESNETRFSVYTFPAINTHSPLRLIDYVYNLKSLSELKKVLKEFNPDVVHLQYFFYHTSPSILTALKDIPAVATIHMYDILSPVGLSRTPQCTHAEIGYCVHCNGITRYGPEVLKRQIFKTLANNVDLYITPSQFYKELHKNIGLNHLEQIYNGFELPQFRPTSDSSHIVYIGRLAEEKGAEFLVRAMPQIINKRNYNFSKHHSHIISQI